MKRGCMSASSNISMLAFKLVYVALSRCTHLGGLYLTNALGDHSFYHREDNPDSAMTDEFRRLENHRLQTVTGRYLDALRREEQRERRRHAFTLALLNVRSLRAHALDVARDPVLQEVDVLCLTETWNNNKQEGGQEARGEGVVGEQGFAPVVRARAVDALAVPVASTSTTETCGGEEGWSVTAGVTPTRAANTPASPPCATTPTVTVTAKTTARSP
ncbi:hypothetical protein HPB49_001408 [Dermacentor silvarum]|uniref:Uncharacterized protein n=1 Tax=Dermacentor silvarum TaxID=543639 RepID=A0ACB8D1U9_DERSI|nr:hypothetical protein HPB49_001408 [Dermacentor silvarum]